MLFCRGLHRLSQLHKALFGNRGQHIIAVAKVAIRRRVRHPDQTRKATQAECRRPVTPHLFECGRQQRRTQVAMVVGFARD